MLTSKQFVQFLQFKFSYYRGRFEVYWIRILHFYSPLLSSNHDDGLSVTSSDLLRMELLLAYKLMMLSVSNLLMNNDRP